MSAEPVEVGGRQLTFPVEVRRASSWAASFLVPAERAQAMIAHTPLQVAQAFPGKAIVTIPFVRYEDTDLDAYNEVGVAVVVRRHEAPPASPAAQALEVARGRVGVFIQHLPVDQAFTLEAGRSLWGFPKIMARIDIRSEGGTAICELTHEGRHVFTLAVREAGPLPLPARTYPTYTYLDGAMRRTRWTTPGARVRGRFGGAELRLGDHPIADELAGLGLPKRALVSQTTPRMRALFGPAEILSA